MTREITMTSDFKKVTELSPSEVAACKRLTMGDAGLMRSQLEDCLRDPDFWSASVGLVYHRGRIVSWSLAFTYRGWWGYGKRCWDVYFFTDPNYRRMGLGRYLYKQMRMRYKSAVRTHPWDPRSDAFFDHLIAA
jgi:GNAT superfamily N-acetyltransferase